MFDLAHPSIVDEAKGYDNNKPHLGWGPIHPK